MLLRGSRLQCSRAPMVLRATFGRRAPDRPTRPIAAKTLGAAPPVEDTKQLHSSSEHPTTRAPIAIRYSCRRHSLTSGRLPLPRHTTLPSPRTSSSPSASPCWCSVRSRKQRRCTSSANHHSFPSCHNLRPQYVRPCTECAHDTNYTPDRSFVNLSILGVPASIAFGYVDAQCSNLGGSADDVIDLAPST